MTHVSLTFPTANETTDLDFMCNDDKIAAIDRFSTFELSSSDFHYTDKTTTMLLFYRLPGQFIKNIYMQYICFQLLFSS